MNITPKYFYDSFKPTTIAQGSILLNNSPINIKDMTTTGMFADVGKVKIHNVLITLEFSNGIDNYKLVSECDCGKDLCSHAAAAVLYYLQNKHRYEQNTDVLNWLDDIAPEPKKETKGNIKTKSKTPIKAGFELLYILQIEERGCYISLKLARYLKSGKFGADKDYVAGNKSHNNALTNIDEKIVFNLSFDPESQYQTNTFLLNNNSSEELLKQMIKTNRCFYESKDSEPLRLGEVESVSPNWHMNEYGEQFLSASSDSEAVVFKIHKLWYVKESFIGEAKTDIPFDILSKILSAPPIPANSIKTVKERIQAICPQIPDPVLPTEFTEKTIIPTPCLHLTTTQMEFRLQSSRSKRYSFYSGFDYDLETRNISVAQLYFRYGNTKISEMDDHTILYDNKNGDTVKILRDFDYEVSQIKKLQKNFKLHRVVDIDEIYDDLDEEMEDYYYIGSEDEAQIFTSNIIPQLKEAGWSITAEDGYTIEIIHDDDLEWYSDLEETEYNWFGLDLGVMIDGEKVNILPLIVNYLKTIDIKEINKSDKEAKIPIQMKDGRTLMLPSKRLQGILNVLTELYDTNPLGDNGELKLDNLSASQLEELEDKLDLDNMTWLGSKKIKKLGQKLKAFTSVQEAKVPDTFKAELRPYQQEGVNWLRFLNEFELGGILADDMGLGKTIQALANLTIEKETNPEFPSLIICPTSIVANWHMEAEKFAPDLKVISLYAGNRKQYYEQLNNYDVIITSYPLVFRDTKILSEKEFNYIILDEAQYIKNHQAKVTKVIYDLKCSHRLCLSGTPIENHLGELWSQFRFLAPGLLGTAEKFRRLYRTPIEKHSDVARRISLASRIKPFLIRRTKAEVAVDLPPKTEIIKVTALGGIQRDLYESIRIAMDKKVRDAISSQGLQRSHIIVLDALLKLRQTCCDPRLLKIESAKKAHGHSAKLDLLMNLLPNMVEEGRKILLFSQFTSMITLIKEELNKHKLEYVTLTGSTKDRATPIKQFQNNEVPIFLISLKAGGIGLNLTAADTIIHYDPWWNPAIENQATDRAHRIGQDKPVFVYKLITEGTVEETIIEMQNKKKDIVDGLLSENSNTKTPLQQSDLTELFKPLDELAQAT